MTDDVFKPGDVVQLKRLSGPWMTIEAIHTNQIVPAFAFTVECVWFDKRRRVQRDTFDSFALELVPAQRPSITMVERKP